MTLGVVLILAAIAIVIKIFPGPDFNLKNTDYTMLTRIQEKIWKVLYGGNSTMLSALVTNLNLTDNYHAFRPGNGPGGIVS